MELQNIFKIYNILHRDDFSFIYRGIFSNNILNLITDLVQNTNNIVERPINNRLTYLTIESFQNVLRYSESKVSSTKHSDLFAFRKIKDKLFIITANLISKKKSEQTEKYLEQINSLSFDELKKLYLDILTNKDFNEKGGAGLGFIEMLRKSKNRLQYKFIPFNNEFNYFFFQIQLKLFKDTRFTELPISQSVELNQISRQLNALLILKSHITQNSVIPLVQIVNQNIHNYNYPIQKKLFSILIELLQDISTCYGENKFSNEAIVVLGKIHKNFYILVGSAVENKILENKLRFINMYKDLNKKQLAEIYLKRLAEENESDFELRILKILSIGKNYEYLTTYINENTYFFSQKIEIEDKS